METPNTKDAASVSACPSAEESVSKAVAFFTPQDNDDLEHTHAASLSSEAAPAMYSRWLQEERESDTFKAWQLRYQFSSGTIYRDGIYQAMLDGHWTFLASTGVYRAPLLPGQTRPLQFSSAKDLLNKLDRPVVPHIDNTLQLPPTSCRQEPEEEKEQDRKALSMLRNDLLKRIRQKFKLEKRGRKAEEEVNLNQKTNEDNNSGDSKVAVASSDASGDSASAMPERLTVRRSTRAASSSAVMTSTSTATSTSKIAATGTATATTRTVTTFEKGADLWIRKARGGTKRKQHETNFTVDVTATEKLDFPSAAQCAHRFCDKLPTKQIQATEQQYARHFKDWMFLLTTRHSLMLYGFGSKRNVLDTFVRDGLSKEGDVLTIHGYDRQVRIQTLLNLIDARLLSNVHTKEEQDELPAIMCETSHGVGMSMPSMLGTDPMVHRAARIARLLAQRARMRKQPLYLVIHNIDGPGFRSRVAQDVLAALVVNSTLKEGVNAVRLVASVDHVNASSLLWDLQTSANFSWVWKQVHTYRPYIDELERGPSVDGQQSISKRRRSNSSNVDHNLLNILTSLAPRHAEVLQIVARQQLDQMNAPLSGGTNTNGLQRGIEHKTLRELCFHKMVATTDTQLRSYLTELKDHGLVDSGVNSTSNHELVWIPHSKEHLHEILEFTVQM